MQVYVGKVHPQNKKFQYVVVFLNHVIVVTQDIDLKRNVYSILTLYLRAYYYIDRCELWGFIHEVNSGISHVRYQFFPAGTTFTQL
jgi:hypothetical protein